MKTSLPLLLASCMLLVAASVGAQPFYGPGSYQGWDINTAIQLVDDGTNGDVASGDGIYSATVNVATAGAYEWKAALGGWSDSWPHTGNCWFITTADNQDVLLTFDVNAYGDGWAADSYWPTSSRTLGTTYTLVGTLQDELGNASDWDPAGTTVMHDDGLNGDAAASDGIYSYSGQLPAGSYDWKVAVNGNWAQQFGTDGPSINASTWNITVDQNGDEWVFELDTNTGRVRAMMNAPVPTEPTTWSNIKQLYQ